MCGRCLDSVDSFTIPENQAELMAKREAEKCIKRAKTREQYRNVVRAGIAQWIDKFKAGEIKIETVSDLRELIEMDLYLEEK